MTTLWNDIKYGLRMLAKTPGFTAVAVISLAIGIGANTTIFSLLNAVLLRSLPVPNPHELRVVNWVGRNPAVNNYTGSGMGRGPAGLTYAGSFPYTAYRDFRDRGSGFAEVFALANLWNLTVVGPDGASTADGLMVSGNFFAGYGAKALIGRTLALEDELPGAPPVAVITYRWWERHFSMDPNVLGQAVTLNKRAFTVIGVLPRTYAGPLPLDSANFYVPMSTQAQLMPDYPLESSNHWWVQIMARLKPGADERQAQASLDVLFKQILTGSSTRMEQPGIWLQAGRCGPAMAREQMAGPLWTVQAVVGVVLLIACANLASLLLARGAASGHDMAVRAAIGASRWRLVGQSLTESLVLAAAGGLLGLVLTAWGRAVLVAVVKGFDENLRLDLAMDIRVLLFTLGLSIATALLFGLIPAIRAARVDPAAGLKDRAALGSPRLRLGRVLVSVQVGLSMLLVVGAGLLVRTLANLNRVDPGFNVESLLLVRLDAGGAGYGGQQRVAFYDQVKQQVAGLPGVQSVGLSDITLLRGSVSCSGVTIPGRAVNPGEHLQANILVIDESFLATMGMRLLLGRPFAPSDVQGGQPVAIINQRFARDFMGDENPIGKTFKVGPSEEYQIVGLCANAKYQSVREDTPPTMYFPFRQGQPGSMVVEVRSSVSPTSLVPQVRRVVAAVDRIIPLADVCTEKDLFLRSILPERIFALLCGALAALALVLSCVGLYGLMAYNVTRRTGEIGIRMALGATPSEVARPVLREAIGLAAAGAAAGGPAALALACLVRSALFGIQPYDPATLIGGLLLLMGVAALAAWIPARRAARVDPMVALRCE